MKTRIATPRLLLTVGSLEEVRAQIASMSEEDKRELSGEWLALLATATSPDPWILGFTITHQSSEEVVGQCGFKGPPDPDGVVEIAYAIDEPHQGRGYATEAAMALVNTATAEQDVKIVRAHTLPESNASARVLTKCGFKNVGPWTDPEDGLVWRWEFLGSHDDDELQ